MTWTVHCADVLAWCEEYAAKIERGEAEPFHAILTDPPYGLSDTPDMADVLTHWLAGDDYEHKGGGFMGKSWDGFVPIPSAWAALRRVCHPGAYLFAFGGTRTADLLSVAIRLGGWERFDEIDSLSWCYGSGFPKSHAIGKAIDREANAGREVVGEYQYPDGKPRNTSQHQTSRNGIYSDIKTDGSLNDRSITAPATPLAAAWEGHGTALKPAHEPILCFRNPKQGMYVQNCTSTGAGGLWIDGSRVGIKDSDPNWRPNECIPTVSTGDSGIYGQYNEPHRQKNNLTTQGRWPPNVVLSHLPGCERLGVKRVRASGYFPAERTPNQIYGGGKGTNIETGFDGTNPHADPDGTEAVDDWACVDGCPVKELGEQAGSSVVRPVKPENIGKSGDGQRKGLFGNRSIVQSDYYDDSASVSRFYPQHDWQHEIAERLAGVTPFRYVSKAGRAQRDAGLEGFERQANDFQRETSGLNQDRPNREGRKPAIPPRNPHPTVKPIALCKWLATLLLPPPEYAPRRVLIPFGGVMSEAIGALLAGWDEIVAIEMEEEYIPIGESRLRFWADWAARGYDDPAAILKATKRKTKKREEAQMELL